eukprot:SAG31_NODE_3511_length_4177_cov_1.817312_2_plen_109_part_00
MSMLTDLEDVGFPPSAAEEIVSTLASRPQSPHISEADLLPMDLLDMDGADDDGSGIHNSSAAPTSSTGGRRMLFERTAADTSNARSSGVGGLGSLWGSSWGPLVGQQS